MTDYYAIYNAKYDVEIELFHFTQDDEEAVQYAQNRYSSYDDLIAYRNDDTTESLGGWNIG